MTLFTHFFILREKLADFSVISLEIAEITRIKQKWEFITQTKEKRDSQKRWKLLFLEESARVGDAR